MIEFNLSVPREIKNDVFKMRNTDFRIITSSPMGGNLQYFLLEASEDDMLYLKLKFGSENVWKR